MMFVSLFAADPSRSPHWLWPEAKEMIWGIPASLVIFFAIWKFAGPPIKKAMADRTDRIRQQLEGAEAAKVAADTEAASIRQAAGDIDGERQRLFAEADAQAEAVLADGRVRLEEEVADLEARAAADIAATAGRATDELRAEISRLAAAAADRVIAEGVREDAMQQSLIENYIARVGASS